ncbi:MAG: MoaD/ThiS family protein [Flavobacteriales bacterium]|nr:MAG: MoaD/ThiS family protein [Flavobacteriales bacterium]
MEILLFGIAKDIVGKSKIQFAAGEGQPTSVKELRQTLESAYPDLGRLSSMAVAVNSEYVRDELILKPGDEIAIIPPVSGG